MDFYFFMKAVNRFLSLISKSFISSGLSMLGIQQNTENAKQSEIISEHSHSDIISLAELMKRIVEFNRVVSNKIKVIKISLIKQIFLL